MLEQNLIQQTKISLTHKQQQSLKLLEMNQLELKTFVDSELLENPLLELDETKLTKQDDFLIQVSRFLEQSSPFIKDGVYSEQSDYELAPPTCNYNPRDEIKEQLYISKADPLLQAIAEQLILMLTPHGFLPYEDKELSNLLACDIANIKTAREILCSLEPFGIASKDVGAFLILQLKQSHQLTSVLQVICSKYLSQVAEKNFRAISAALSISVSEVKKNVRLITKLKPFPLQIEQSSQTAYIIPDLLVKKEKDEWRLYLNDSYSRSLSVSPLYYSYINQQNTPETKTYLKEKIERAQFMIEMLEKRNQTLIAIGNQIIKKQQFFFETMSLSPYSQSQMAKELALNNSTVSRAIKGKYLQCQWGTFPLKSFFSVELPNNPAQTKDTVKENLFLLIQSEPKTKPYSDQQLADLLKQQGITLSRRTIAKYRLAMNIAGTSERKQ